MLKMFCVLMVLIVNFKYFRLFPVFVYKICVGLLYYTSLGHFLFHRYDGFSLKLIFQKIPKLQVIFIIFSCSKIYLTKWCKFCYFYIELFTMIYFCSKYLILWKICQLFINKTFANNWEKIKIVNILFSHSAYENLENFNKK